MAQSNDSGEHVEFTRTRSQKAVAVSTDVLLVAMPVATLAGVLLEHDMEGLKQGALSLATTLGAMMILKMAVREDRPDHSNRHSFPSGHSSLTFSDATFVMRRYGWKVGVPAYVLSSYVAWGRVYGKKHHWWDVVTGAAIGTGSSLIFTRPWARDHSLNVSAVPTGDGMMLSASMVF